MDGTDAGAKVGCVPCLVATCFWPGLPRLWCRGEWSSLAAAVAFGAALNLVLVSSFVWPELLPSSLVLAGWLLVLAACCHFGDASRIAVLPELLCTARVDDRGLFIRAQGEYLQGHWFEAEASLQQLLRRSPRDVDAGLMLATLYRHTRRYDEALAWSRATGPIWRRLSGGNGKSPANGS